MGDMADFALEAVEDMEIARLQYLHGEISDLEAYDRGIIGEDGTILSPGHQRPKQCRYCKKHGLVWGRHNDSWRLFDGEHVHECNEYDSRRVLR